MTVADHAGEESDGAETSCVGEETVNRREETVISCAYVEVVTYSDLGEAATLKRLAPDHGRREVDGERVTWSNHEREERESRTGDILRPGEEVRHVQGNENRTVGGEEGEEENAENASGRESGKRIGTWIVLVVHNHGHGEVGEA